MKNQEKKHLLYFPVITMGFTSIAAQIVFIRELFVVFYGNELSLGIVLSVWLFWTAAGSMGLHHFFSKTKDSRRILISIQLVISLLLPLVFIWIKLSRSLVGAVPGELIGFLPMLLISLLTLTPFCLLSGLFFPLSCKTFQDEKKKNINTAGIVYLFEAIGSGAGGLLLSLTLIRLLPSASIVLFLSALNVISAIWLLPHFQKKKVCCKIVWMLSLIVILSTFIYQTTPEFRSFSDRLEWKGHNLIDTKNTIYGNLAVTRLDEQINFFQNGLFMFSVPDQMTAEESVHYALIEHPEPESVLLIGNGFGGGLQEILRHPGIQTVQYVELDPMVLKLAEKHLSKEQMDVIQNPRITIHHMDGRQFIKTTQARFDVIILNLPNPYTAQLNRFYTLEFFTEVKEKLQTDGIFSIQLASSENAIGPELSDFLSIEYETLKTIFNKCILLPGETCRIICSNTKFNLTTDPDVLINRLKERNLKTRFVREYFMPFQLSEERQQYLKSRLHPVDRSKLNKDFKPVGYYFDTVLWATTYSTVFKDLFLKFARLKPHQIGSVLIFVTLIMIAASFVFGGKQQVLKSGIICSVIGMGFTEISLTVILVLGFQILYGYIYQYIALVITGYMIGLTLGSLKSAHQNNARPVELKRFKLFQSMMLCYSIFLISIFMLFHRYPIFNSNHIWAGICFMIIAGGAGFIGGFQFPLANRLFQYFGDKPEKTAGFIYGADLLGSSAGAILTSAFLIPILGIFSTLLLLSLLNLCVLGMLALHKTTDNMPIQVK